MKLRKSLAGFLSVILLTALLSLSAFAEEPAPDTPTIVTTEEALITALNAGGSIKLGSSIELQGVLTAPSGKEAVLDLAGYSLAQTGTYIDDEGLDWYYNVINNSGNLTLKDSIGNGSITGRVYNAEGAELIIESGTINGDAYGKCPVWNDGTATIQNAVVSASAPDSDYAVYNFGVLTIDGGTYSSVWTAVGNDGGSLTINGGEFTGNPYCVSNESYESGNSPQLTVNDGTFVGTIRLEGTVNFTKESTFNKVEAKGDVNLTNVKTDSLALSGTISTGIYENVTSCSAAFPADSAAQVIFKDATLEKASISGGTFTGTIETVKTAPKQSTISGGSFSASVYETLVSASVSYSSGKGWKDNMDGTYSVVEMGTAEFNVMPGANGSLKDIKYKYGSSVTNGGANISGKTVTNGGKVTVSATAVPADNYVFAGWYTNPEGSGQALSLETSLTDFEYTVNGDTTIYAVFKESAEYEALAAAAREWLEKGTYEITSTADMYSFAYAVNNLGETFEGKTVSLKTDLDYSAEGAAPFMPVGGTIKFEGTFDGKNYTISNLVYTDNTSDSRVGIFGYNVGTIKKLNVSDCTFTGSDVAGIAAWSEGTIEECSVKDSALNGSYRYTGGVVGHTFGMTMKNVTVTGNTLKGWKTGAVVGYADGLKAADVTAENNSYTGEGVYGVLCGHLNAGESSLQGGTIKASETEAAEPLIGSNYSGAEGTFTISESEEKKTTIDVSVISGDMTENKKYTIEGGAFTIDSVLSESAEAKGTLTATGGLFSADVSDYCVEGYTAKMQKNEDGMYVIVTEELADQVDNISNGIQGLPSADKVTADNADAIIAAKEAYDKLSDEEKALVSAEEKAKLDAAVEALNKLNDNKEENGGNNGGNNGNSSNNNSNSGNSGAGNGTGSGKNPAAVQTGDEANLILWGILAVLAAVAVGSIVVVRKRKNHR